MDEDEIARARAAVHDADRELGRAYFDVLSRLPSEHVFATLDEKVLELAERGGPDVLERIYAARIAYLRTTAIIRMPFSAPFRKVT